jgi:hypothetical protein
MIGVFVIAMIFVGGPIARAIARSIERGGVRPAQEPRVEGELRQALQVAEQRLSDSETRLAALEDRLDFYEKLLANPTSSSAPVPPSRPS